MVLADSFKGQSFYTVLNKLIPELGTCDRGNLITKVVPSLKYVIMMFDEDKPGTIPLKEVMMNGESKEAKAALEGAARKLQADECVNIQFTSGTTGQPKAASLTHFSLINAAHGFGRSIQLSGEVSANVPLTFG